MGDFLLRKMPVRVAPFAAVAGVFLALFLAGCAGEVPVPFLNAALPPAPPGPAPEYPSISPPVVEGTRIGVHDVVGLLQNGESVDSIISSCFPELTRAQVYECLVYYEDHRGEIDLLIARQMAPGA